MIWVFVLVGALVTFAIAAAVVGREAGLLASAPPRTLFDLEEAVEYVADRLPGHVTAELSHAEVATVLAWHLDFLAEAGAVVVTADNDPAPGLELVTDEEVAAYVLGRAGKTGAGMSDEHLVAVVDAGAAYLRAIGAIEPIGGDEKSSQ
ncbi:hypothetical protein BH24ACT3_BH24ACT3_19470 [soil metagenome]